MRDLSRARKLIRYVISVLESHGPKEPRVPVDHFAEVYVAPCLDLAHGIIFEISRDPSAAEKLLAELLKALDRAEALFRGDDLDTVRAGHLRPVSKEARELAIRLAAAPTMSSDEVWAEVDGVKIQVSTFPYFDVYVCRWLSHEAIQALTDVSTK